MFSGNPAADYPYAFVVGRVFHERVADIAPLMKSLVTDTAHTNLDLQSLVCRLANESPTARTYGVDYTDVRQGALGDCGMIAGMGEVALRKPWDIASDITQNPDGTLTVALRQYGADPVLVTMTPDLPFWAGGDETLRYAQVGASVHDTSAILWPAYLEKAVAQYVGSYRGSYGTLSGVEGMFAWEEMGWLTGQFMLGHTRGTDQHDTFVSTWNAGECVCLQTPVNEPNPNIIPNHDYIEVSYDAATDSVTLMNPWGIDAGLTVETWPQVQIDFQTFDRTT